MKNKNKKEKIRNYSFLFATIPLVIIIALMSRVIPDGTQRLDIGKSEIGKKAIALTFDDGPGDYTAELLDGLKKYDAKATFFVLGSKAEKHPSLVKRAYDEGHLIGNHSYSHKNLLRSSTDTAINEIKRCGDVVENITGERPLFYRPPHGYITAYQLKKFDSFYVKWSFDTYDWRKDKSEEVYKDIMEHAKDGQIILLHDTKETTVDAVLKAIPELQAQGFKLVRVDSLLSRNGEKLKKGILYKSCKHTENVVIHDPEYEKEPEIIDIKYAKSK